MYAVLAARARERVAGVAARERVDVVTDVEVALLLMTSAGAAA